MASEDEQFNVPSTDDEVATTTTTTADARVVDEADHPVDHGAGDHDDAEPAEPVDTTAAETEHDDTEVTVDPSLEAVVDGWNTDHDFTDAEIEAKMAAMAGAPREQSVKQTLRFLENLDPIGRNRLVMIDPKTDRELREAARYAVVKGGVTPTADDEARIEAMYRKLKAEQQDPTNKRPQAKIEARDVVGVGDGGAGVGSAKNAVGEWMHARDGRAMYYQVNAPKAESATKKATDADIEFLRALYLDIDPDKSKLGLSLPQATFAHNWAVERLKLDRIRDRMDAGVVAPTIVVSSGAGLQLLWIFAEPVEATAQNVALYRRMQMALLTLCPEADQGVRDLSRVLRLPGSLHTKYKAQGYVRTAGMQSVSLEPRLTFTDLAAALEPWMPAEPEPAGGKRPAARKADRAAVTTVGGVVDAGAVDAGAAGADHLVAEVEVPRARPTRDDIDALVATITDPKEGLLDELKAAPGRLGRLWKKGSSYVAEGKDRSGSAMRFLLAKYMGAFGYTFSDVWAAAQAWPHSNGRNPWDERSLARNWLADTEARETELARRDDRATGRDVRDGDGRLEVRVDPLAITATMTQVVRGLAEQRGDGLDVVLRHGRLVTERVVSVAAVEGAAGNAHSAIRTLGPAFGGTIDACIQARIKPVIVADGEVTEVPVPAGWAKALTAHISKFPGELPVAMGVAEPPFVRTDGSMVMRRGLDHATSTWVLDDIDVPPVPAVVDKAMAVAALAELAGLLIEFPFAGDEGSDEAALNLSAALCGIFTAVLRPNLRTAPAYLMTAPTPGSGKSELSRLMCTFATGGHVPLMGATSDTEEFAKRLNAALLAGPRCLVIDNLVGRLDGDTLAMLLTTPTMTVRELGSSSFHEVSTRIFLAVNGNNVSVRDDLCRRFIEVRLDPRLERPEQRTFSRDPVAEVHADRGRWLRLVAIILRGWRLSLDGEAGKPAGGAAGFGEWYDCCVRPLLWLGYPDPVATQTGLRQGDEELEALEALFKALSTIFGRWDFTTKVIVDLVRGVTPVVEVEGDADADPDDEAVVAADAARAEAGVALREAIGMLIDENRLRANAAKAIGQLLRRYRGRVVGALRLVEVGATHGRRRWRLARQ